MAGVTATATNAGARATPPVPPALRDVLRERAFWGLAVLGIGFFHRVLFFGEAFFYRDLSHHAVPQRRFLAEVLGAGELPLWNPLLHAGFPLAADISNSAFYPTALFALVLSPFQAVTMEIVLHVIAAAAATYLLARRLGLAAAPALVAATAYGYCGYSLSQVCLARFSALPYLPLALLFWHALLVERRTRWFVAAVLAGFLLALTPAPELVLLSFLTVLGAVLACRGAPWPAARRAGLWLLWSGAAAGLAAFQLLPTLELLRASARGRGIELAAAGAWSLHPLRLPELVVPGFTGSLHGLDSGAYWGARLVDEGHPYVLSLYFGVPVLALALMGLVGQSALRRGLRIFAGALAAVAFVLALGRFLPFFELFYTAVPGLHAFRTPVKFLDLGILPLALLAGAGTEALFAFPGPGRRVLAGAALLAGAAGALWLGLVASPAWAEALELFFFGRSGAEITAGLSGGLLLVLEITTLAALSLVLLRRHRRAGEWAIAGLVVVDLLTSGARVNPTAPRALLEQTPPIVEQVAAALVEGRRTQGRLYTDVPWSTLSAAPTDDVVWRHVWMWQVLSDRSGSAFGLPLALHRDLTGLAPARIGELRDLVAALPWPRRLPLLSAAAVRVIVAPPGLESLPGVEPVAEVASLSGVPVQVYRYTAAAERAELVTLWRRVSSPEEARREMLFRDYDPRLHAVVEGEVPGEPAALCTSRGEVTVEALASSRHLFSVAHDCPSLLVVSEGFFPGWQARTDGVVVPVLRVNYAFRGVYLEPGEHSVEWLYRPRSFLWGVAVSFLSALAVAGVAVCGWRRRRNRGRPSPRTEKEIP